MSDEYSLHTKWQRGDISTPEYERRMDRLILTAQQEERMSVLMEGTKVVGEEDECPIVVYRNGQMRRVTKEGRVVAPSKIAQDRIMRRMVARWERDEHDRPS